jgi:hypothetical protein
MENVFITDNSAQKKKTKPFIENYKFISLFIANWIWTIQFHITLDIWISFSVTDLMPQIGSI